MMQSICRSYYPSKFFVRVCIHLFTLLSVCPFIYSRFYMYVHLFIQIFFQLPFIYSPLRSYPFNHLCFRGCWTRRPLPTCFQKWTRFSKDKSPSFCPLKSLKWLYNFLTFQSWKVFPSIGFCFLFISPSSWGH